MQSPPSPVPHTDDWKVLYGSEAVLLKKLFGSYLIDMQHIGSTAVPDLLAKPIIDIAVQIATYADADRFIAPLQELGYAYKPELSSVERHFFQKGEPILFHLSISYLDRGGYWGRQIAFRDYLTGHSEARREYEQIKLRSADKSEFVQRILDSAAAK